MRTGCMALNHDTRRTLVNSIVIIGISGLWTMTSQSCILSSLFSAQNGSSRSFFIGLVKNTLNVRRMIHFEGYIVYFIPLIGTYCS